MNTYYFNKYSLYSLLTVPLNRLRKVVNRVEVISSAGRIEF